MPRGMWSIVIPAGIAAAAALGGVALGALVEPLKLRAARRARVRQDRAERCAKLIEAAMSCRARLLSLNLAHRQVAAGELLEGNSEEDRLDLYRTVRNELRQTVALIKLGGPDDLADAAMAVRQAERQFRAVRFAQDDDGHFNRDVPPKAVLDGARGLEQAVHEFALVARNHVT